MKGLHRIKLWSKEPLKLICGIFLITIFLIFPLYYEDYYFDIADAKYRFYWIASLLFLIITAAIIIKERLCVSISKNPKNGPRCSQLSFMRRFRNSWPVWLLLVFWVNSIVSTIQSDYIYESFWGNEGRYCGLFLLSIYTWTTIALIFNAYVSKVYLNVFLFSSFLVETLGIFDYFGLDILQFKTWGEVVGEMPLFISTIGNLNFYTAFLSMSLAVAVVFYVLEEQSNRRIVYFILSAIAYVGIICGQSDNAYISIGTLFAFLPFVFFNSREKIFRVMVQYTLCASVMYILGFISASVLGKQEDSGILQLVYQRNEFKVLIILLIVMSAVLFVWKKTPNDNNRINDAVLIKRIQIAWRILFVSVVIMTCAVLIDANFLGHGERYAGITNYLVINDDWGTERGYAWRIGLEAWWSQPWKHRLFGFGPETYGILTWPYRVDSRQSYGFIYDSMHNEYLQNLVTMGPIGMLSYIGMIIGTLITVLKPAKKQPWLYAVVGAITCYAMQAIVNISMPMVAPIFWALIGLGIAAVKENSNHQQQS